MTKDKALRLALEALEVANSCVDGYYIPKGKAHLPEIELAITAIKEALAQPEPNYKKALEVWLDKTEWVQETVKPHELGMHRADVLKQRIQEASPQRTWVGLTDEEIKRIGKLDLDSNYFGLWYDFAKAIEAKLKEKNT
jgi:hypothetical protein